jgi:hypothetical protein
MTADRTRKCHMRSQGTLIKTEIKFEVSRAVKLHTVIFRVGDEGCRVVPS